jgi:hypothetical protein
MCHPGAGVDSYDNETVLVHGFLHSNINQHYSVFSGSRDSLVGIALGYGLDDRGSRVRFPAGVGNFSLHHRVQNGSGAHPASCRMGTRGSFPGVKRPGREADHSPPSSAGYTSTPPVRLHGAVLS